METRTSHPIHTPPGAATVVRGSVSRRLFGAFGWGFFATGAVGIVVPLMPTTVFWILAAWCWMRAADPALRRVLDDPRFGPAIVRFLAHGELTRRGKVFAVGGMTGGVSLWALLASPSAPLLGAVALPLAAVAAWLLTRPEGGTADEPIPLGVEAAYPIVDYRNQRGLR